MMEQRCGAMQHLVVKEAAHNHLRLRQLCSRLEPADNREPPVTRVALAVSPPKGIGNSLRGGKRQPSIEISTRRNSCESLFSYTDNRESNIVQFDHAADHIARAAEGALPVAVVQHGDRCG